MQLVAHADGRQCNRISYQYDALGQLVRENDPFDTTAGLKGTTWVYAYDQGSNILSKKAYPFTEVIKYEKTYSFEVRVKKTVQRYEPCGGVTDFSAVTGINSIDVIGTINTLHTYGSLGAPDPYTGIALTGFYIMYDLWVSISDMLGTVNLPKTHTETIYEISIPTLYERR